MDDWIKALPLSIALTLLGACTDDSGETDAGDEVSETEDSGSEGTGESGGSGESDTDTGESGDTGESDTDTGDTGGPWLSARLTQAKEALFAAPDYLARAGTPACLEDLHRRSLFSWTPPEHAPERWPLRTGGSFVAPLAHCSPDMGLIRRCAVDGLGIARIPKGEIPDPDVEAGSLVPVLADLIGRPLQLRVVMPDSPRMRRPYRSFFGNVREGVNELDDG